jgi:hypothetical protein
VSYTPTAADLEAAYMTVRTEIMNGTRSVRTLTAEQLAGMLLRVSGGVDEALEHSRFIVVNAFTQKLKWAEALRLIEALDPRREQ